ncbi:TPA: phage protein NinX family protein [Serratia marcescens]
MTDYSKMSDKEINHSVLAIFEPDIEHMMLGGNETHFYHCGITGDGYHQIDIPDYCNNPAYAWPIIFENKISIISMYSGGDSWQVDAGEDEEFVLHNQSNPLRAAMIVFLMMKDSEKC